MRIALTTGAGTQTVVTQGVQTRTYVYDGLGRLTSETNPEDGNAATTYVYDTDSACNFSGLSTTSTGDLVSMTDPNGNKTCYSYDPLHRLTDVGVLKNGSCYPPVKRFRYDNSNAVLPAPSGYSSSSNTKGRTFEAWTGDCVWPTPSDGYDTATDEWFTYDARGQMTDLWESTAHISGYFHGTAAYAANGAVTSIGGIPGYTSIGYTLDGEGRPNTAVQGTTNLVTGVTYNAGSQAQVISLGAGDSDNYVYDPNTGRMTNYTFTVGSPSKSVIGGPSWNTNGTLQQLAVTRDDFNSGGVETCNFLYDDLGRIGTPPNSPPNPSSNSVDCGSSVWQQKFSYDQYNNITKTGSSTWEPGYDPTTNHALGLTYDNNGNITNDTQYNYGWYVDNKLGSISSTTCTIFGSSDGTCILYDAFGREVERGVNGVYTEVMYTPVGKTAIMTNETTALNAYFPLPGGATYDQTGSTNGTGYFWHKDWLGSVRLSSSVLSRTFQFDRAFAPYGEMYDNFGSTGGLSFTGDTQDSFPALLFDTPNRELSSSEGRWMSPDPGGLGAVNMSNPQTWNRYGYVAANPLSAIDPTGLADTTTTACRNSWNASSHNCVRYSANCTQAAGFCPPAPLNGDPLTLLNYGIRIVAVAAGQRQWVGTYGYYVNWNSTTGTGTYKYVMGHWLDSVDMGPAGVIDDGHPGLGAFYDSADCSTCGQILRHAAGSMNELTAAYAIGFGALAGGAALGSLEWVDIAVGPGNPFHVAFGVDGTWLHATGDFFEMEITGDQAAAFARMSWFQFSVPVLNSQAVTATVGAAASTCVTGACYAVLQGWIH